MTRSYSAALPVAYVVLRILIVANWVVGAGIIGLLIAPHADWLMASLKLAPSPDTTRFIWGMRAVAVLGLACVPINHFILTRLLAIVETVRQGRAFIADNAYRLLFIAWALLSLQIVGLIIGGIGAAIDSPAHPLRLSIDFSPAGWLAVLATFILARIFAEGTLMREDLDATI